MPTGRDPLGNNRGDSKPSKAIPESGIEPHLEPNTVLLVILRLGPPVKIQVYWRGPQDEFVSHWPESSGEPKQHTPSLAALSIAWLCAGFHHENGSEELCRQTSLEAKTEARWLEIRAPESKTWLGTLGNAYEQSDLQDMKAVQSLRQAMKASFGETDWWSAKNPKDKEKLSVFRSRLPQPVPGAFFESGPRLLFAAGGVADAQRIAGSTTLYLARTIEENCGKWSPLLHPPQASAAPGQAVRPLSTVTEDPDLNPEHSAIKMAWRNALQDRLRRHPFMSKDDNQADVFLRFTDRLFRKHFVSPEFAFVQPPLPGMPSLPLDHRWVEIRVLEQNGGSGRPNSSKRIALQSLGYFRSNQPIQTLLADRDNYIIIGDPGAGKSTLLRWTSQHLIRETRGQSLIPIYISLRSYSRWRSQHPDGTVYRFFWEQHLGLPSREFEAFDHLMQDVEGGPKELRNLSRVLLDGWDEVPETLRPSLELELERFAWLVPTLVASRPQQLRVSSLQARTFEIVPLGFESMRALMKEHFQAQGNPRLEQVLCEHLDRHLGLRDLARNPYVLTLLCAVVAKGGSVTHLLDTREALYREAFKLFAAYCREHFASEGYTFSTELMRLSERAAYSLLARPEASPFTFLPSEVDPGGGGVLFQTWNKARLITLESATDQTYSFLHATLQEYLAGMELTRRIGDLGVREQMGVVLGQRWLGALVFAAPSVDHQSPLWLVLGNLVRNPDRFGLIVKRVAAVLAERGVQDGGLSLIGIDLRPRLWASLWASPDPKPYLDVMVELDANYAVDACLEERELDADSIARVVGLHARLPSHHPKRSALVQLIAEGQMRNLSNVNELESLELIDLVGFSPVAASSLSTADEVRSATEILEQLASASGKPRVRSLRMRLALSGSQEGESYLVQSFNAASEPEEITELIEALGTLGTLHARDAVLAKLKEFAKGPDEVLVKALGMLRVYPISDEAELILGFLHSPRDRRVRVAAALALGGAQSDALLRRLSDHARIPDELDVEVRKAVLSALARARSVAIVRILTLEDEGVRSEPGERLAVTGYLAEIARSTSHKYDPGRVMDPIRRYFETRLAAPDLEGLEVELSAAVSDSPNIRRLHIEIVNNNALPLKLRNAACRAIGETMDADGLVSLRELLPTLLQSSTAMGTKQQSLLPEVAQTIALLDPEFLIAIRHPLVEQALWKVCLQSEYLVFEDSIVNLGASGTRVSRAAGSSSAGGNL